jgi:GAF domain-containing protein
VRIDQRVAGRAATLDGQVTVLEPNKRLALQARDRDGIKVGIDAVLTPDGTSTLLRWALRGAMPLQASRADESELAIPVRAGEQSLGVLEILRTPAGSFEEEELNLLSALAGQLAVALQKAEAAAQTERLARQMATLYDVGLETTALRDLRLLFAKATAEAGRLIRADHTSVLRLDPAEGLLRFYAAWAERLIGVDAPGSTSANLPYLGHTVCKRPMFPMEPDTPFQPEALLFQR